MNTEAFYQACLELGIEVTEAMKTQYETYKSLIQSVNQIHNLTAITDDEGIYLKHFFDSLLISPYIPSGSHLLDVGSGAGFPGMVLAIARPDIHVTCMEPTTKRSDFLEQVAKACQLPNVVVVNERAEDAVVRLRESFDVVTARAVAALDMLSELTLPFVKVGGLFLAMKGMKGNEEVDQAAFAIKTLGGKVIASDAFEDEHMGKRYIVTIEKIKGTPKQYPRSYAKIKKTPLRGRHHG